MAQHDKARGQTVGNFSDLMTDKSNAETVAEGSQQGLDPTQSMAYAEKAMYDASLEERTPILQENMREPDKAEQLSQSVDAAKASGAPGGPGILTTIFAGIAGAAGGGSALTSKIMKEGDPKNIARQAEADQATKDKNAANKAGYDDATRKRGVDAARGDPNSDISVRYAEEMGAILTKMGNPEYATLVKGKSYADIEKLFGNLQGPMKEKFLKAQADIKGEEVIAGRIAGRDEKDAVREFTSEEKGLDRQLARDLANQKSKDTANNRERSSTKGRNKGLLKRYDVLADYAQKFPDTIKNIDKITELSGRVDTGVFVGNDVNVYLRKLAGNKDLEQLDSLIKGLPLPLLKKTFGAQFTQIEGQTLAKSLAQLNMSPEVLQRRMATLRDNAIAFYQEYKDQTAYLDDPENADSLIGYKSKGTPTDEELGIASDDKSGDIMEGQQRKSNKTGEVQTYKDGEWVSG